MGQGMAKTIDRREFLKVTFAAVAAALFHKAVVPPTATDAAPSVVNLEIEDSGKLYVDSTSARIEFSSGSELLSNVHSDYSYNVQRGDLIVAPDCHRDNIILEPDETGYIRWKSA